MSLHPVQGSQPGRTLARLRVAAALQPGKQLETLGTYLRRSREQRGVSLEQIAGTTKITVSWLRLIEEDRYDLLPAEVFTVGFLRQYAGVVGLDSEEVVLRYRKVVQNGFPGTAESKSEVFSGRRKKALLFLVGLLFGLGILWVFFSPGDTGKEERVRAIRLPKSTPRETRKAQLRKDLELDAVGKRNPTEEGMIPGGPDPGGEGSGGTSVAEREGHLVEILVQATRKTWIQAEMDDSPPVGRTLMAGEQCAFKAKETIQLRVGNGNGVKIVYRGRVFENLGKKGDVIQITFPPPDSG